MLADCYSLASITIPSSVTQIQGSAIAKCYSLASITIPSSVTSIGESSFYNCYSLASITIPSSMTSIENYAFNNCYGLVKLDCSACTQIPTLGNTNALQNTNADLKIIVPNTLYSQWKSATNWSTYADHIVMANPSMSFKATQANSTIRLTQVGNPTPVSLEYLTTGSWTPYTIGDTITLANVGDEVFFRATSGVNNKFGVDASNYHQFVMTGEIEANYSINYLLNQNATDSTLADNSYLFYKLFSGCSALTKAPELPETTMDEACYAYMFQGTSIEDMPKMPVATLDVDCYKGMFQDNTALTTATLEDSTMANGCYDAMFKGCSSLAEITTVYLGNFSTTYFNDWVDGVAASGTFYYNGSDTTQGASAIPTGWTVLQIPRPELCFTARAANSTVAMSWNSGSAPELSLEYSTDGVTWSPFVKGTTTVTLANVDDKMWLRATSTNTQTASSNYAYNYFSMTGQIAASGNINSLLAKEGFDQISKPATYAYAYLFLNCYSLVDATELKLTCTGLNNNSYGHMFEGCSNLVGGPDIYVNPMTSSNTGNWSMEYMFRNCSSLNSVKLRATGSDWNSSATGNWMTGVPNTGTFYYNGTYTGRGTGAIPTGWTITPFT